MIARPASCLRDNPLKAQAAKLKCIDKDIDHTHRIIFADVIIQMFRKLCALAAVFAFNKTLHMNLRHSDARIISCEAF